MPRYRITIEYDGTGFVGWQRQDNGLGVQQVIEEAVEGFSGEVVRLHVAGRTDAGVHALGQVAHFDLVKDPSPGTVRDALNFHLKGHAVAVLAAETVADDFHARFSATERSYLYRIVNRRAPLTVDRDRAWWVPSRIDVEALAAGAKVLEGQHDFSTFRASECQAKSPLKTLDELRVECSGEEIRIHARARSFLHHQVRNMVGTLRWVGEGKWSPDDLARALEARDRTRGGPTAPAAGLYLVEVGYGA